MKLTQLPAAILATALTIDTHSQAASPAQAAENTALPFDLAYSVRKFPWLEDPAVSPNVAHVAYSVRQTPPDANLNERWQPNGTPSSAVGSRILLSSLEATASSSRAGRDICPREGNCWRPVWSPDSRYVLFYSDANGPPRLWVYSVDEGEARQVATARAKPKLWVGDEPIWHPNGREVYLPLAPEEPRVTESRASSPDRAEPRGDEERKRGVTVTVYGAGTELEHVPQSRRATTPIEEFYLKENNASVGAIDVKTGAVRVVAAATASPRPSVLRLSPSGRWVTYLSVFKRHADTTQQSTMDLALVPSAGGPVHVLAEDLTEHETDYHRLNYTWHPSEDLLVYLRDKRLWLVDLHGDVPSPPRQLAGELGELAPFPLWFTRDGRSVVAGAKPIDEKDYADPRPGQLAVVPLDDGSPIVFPIGSEWEYRGLIKTNGNTIWQPDGRSLTVLLLIRATGETAIARFDTTGGGAAKLLWKGLARIENLTANGHHDFIVGRYQDLGTPPDLYRFDRTFSTKVRLSTVEPRLDPVLGGTVEIFESIVPVHDGQLEKVRTAVVLPPGAKRGDRLPGIVLMYPGGDASRGADLFGGGDRITVPTLVFTSRGYAVVYPHLKLGPNREAGNPIQEMTDVLLPQVYRAAELGYIDVQRVGLAGQSFGGYGTAAIISHTNLFRSAVAISGIFDLAGKWGDLGPDGSSFWVGWSEGGQARMGTHPWANLRRYIDNSPYYQADKIRTPLLIVHGDKEHAYDDAEKLFSALRRLNRTVQLAVYHGEGHVISEWTLENAADAARRTVEFFDRHLRAGR